MNILQNKDKEKKPYGIDIVAKVQVAVLFLFSLVLMMAIGHVLDLGEATSNLSGHVLSEAQWKQKEKSMTPVEIGFEHELGGLMLSGYPLPFEETQNRFYLSVDRQSLLTKKGSAGSWVIDGELACYGDLDGFFILEDAYIKTGKSGMQQAGLLQAIQDGHEFQVLLCQGENYWKAGLVCTGLPLVSITTSWEEPQEYPIEDIDNYVFHSETRYYGEITIFQPSQESQVIQREVCYHERGQTSAVFSKKSYALRLMNAGLEKVSTSLLGMESCEKWKLNALYSDVSKIRDKTCLDLWKEISQQQDGFDESGAEMEYCEVILDGEYRGIYGLMLPVDEETLDLEADEILYKVLDWEMPTAADIQSSIDQNYEVCYPIRIRYPEKKDSVERLWEPMEIYLSAKYWAPDMGLYEDMTFADNLADYMIYIQAVSGYDNYLKNTYLTAAPANNVAGYKMVTIPWDMNYTFGDCYAYDPEHNYLQFNADPTVNYVEPVLEQYFRQEGQDRGVLLKQKWMQYRSQILSAQHICELMRKNQDELVQAGAFMREQQIWPEVENTTDLSVLEQYVQSRISYLDGYFAQY